MPASQRSPAPRPAQDAGAGRINAGSVSTQKKAEGSIVFAANLVANDVVTVNGVAFTAKATGAVGNQFNIDTTLTLTLDALVTVLNASAVAAVALSTYSKVGATTLKAVYDLNGEAGNLVTLAATTATPVTSITPKLLGGGLSDVDTGKNETLIFTTQADNVGAFVLADGLDGQSRTLFLAVKGANANLVVTGTFAGATTATFDAAGDLVVLKWLANAWRVVTNVGTVVFA